MGETRGGAPWALPVGRRGVEVGPLVLPRVVGSDTKLLAFLEDSCVSRRGPSPHWKSNHIWLLAPEINANTPGRLKACRLLDHLHQ